MAKMNAREEKRLESIRDKMQQLKAEQQKITAKDKAQQRKARTRRLIQYGAIAEKYLHCKDVEPGEFDNLLRQALKAEKKP